MSYCNCGRELTAEDKFCPNCGKYNALSQSITSYTDADFPLTGAARGINAIAFILPTMFWLPMLLYPGNPKARHNANQGLWLCTIAFFTLLLSGIYYVSFGLISGAVDIFSVHLLFDNIFATNLIVSYPWMPLPLTIVSLFISICSIVGFIRCIQKGSWSIPVFGKRQLI